MSTSDSASSGRDRLAHRVARSSSGTSSGSSAGSSSGTGSQITALVRFVNAAPKTSGGAGLDLCVRDATATAFTGNGIEGAAGVAYAAAGDFKTVDKARREFTRRCCRLRIAAMRTSSST